MTSQRQYLTFAWRRRWTAKSAIDDFLRNCVFRTSNSVWEMKQCLSSNTVTTFLVQVLYIHSTWHYRCYPTFSWWRHQWNHFSRYWPIFVRGIHRSPVNSPHKGQWRGALMFSLISVWIHNWVNSGEAVDLRRHRAHYDVTVMLCHKTPSAYRRRVNINVKVISKRMKIVTNIN